MLEALGGIAGTIVAGSKIAGGTKNAISSVKKTVTGLKKYNAKQNAKSRFKKKTVAPGQTVTK